MYARSLGSGVAGGCRAALSLGFENQRTKYYEALQRVRTHGDWSGWLLFFLNGVTPTAQDARQQSQRLLDLREEYRLRLLNRPKVLALVDELFANP